MSEMPQSQAFPSPWNDAYSKTGSIDASIAHTSLQSDRNSTSAESHPAPNQETFCVMAAY